jgi:TolB-like protein/Tfp pilus assembly protein PilF/predicted Ser/Thr protein kinase
MVGETILHYKILQKLGEGGMGVVYKAEDTKLKREVAIKFLPHQISANEEEKQRFEIEAQAAAALNHPNIATIYAIEESDKEVFIAMEYIEGIELKDKISKAIPPVEESINIIEQICQGLKAAHQKGITHRDIKSSNIMVTDAGQIKIMDFGLAKVRGVSQITKFGTTLGTTAYMSPEQARGEHVDQRTDIWSLGIIAYELLTGKTPYEGEFEQAIIYSILNEEPKPLITIRKDIPLKVERVVMKMLARNKEQRYQDTAEILNDLNDLKTKVTVENNSDEKKTLAVLPFENISPDKEADYFAEGLSEELVTNLSKLKVAEVIAPTNTMRYKGTNKDIKTLGRELGARYVMQGSVRKFKDDLRISVKLMDVAREIQLWGETYKGKIEDVFDIQEKVAKEIVEALRISLSPTEKMVLEKRSTLNHEAFDLYLKARNFLYKISKTNVRFAIQMFSKAIEIDPRYASGYAGLCEAYASQYRYFEKDSTLLEKAVDSGLRALMYDPNLSEAYSALALAYFEKKLLNEAFTAGQKAIELDPNNYIAYWMLGRIYHSTDKDEEAIKLYKKVIQINPDFYSAYSDLGTSYETLGNEEENKHVQQTLMDVYPRYLSQNPDDSRAHIFYAHSLAHLGKMNEAEKEAEKALELSPNDALMSYNVACLHARLGNKDLSIKYLNQAINSGYANYEWIKRDPDLNTIRNEPEYIELLKGKKEN